MGEHALNFEDVAIYFLPSLVQNMKHLFSLLRLCTQTASDFYSPQGQRGENCPLSQEVLDHTEGTIQPSRTQAGLLQESHAPAFIPGSTCPEEPGRREAKHKEPRLCPLGTSSGMELQMHLVAWPSSQRDGAFRRL